MLRMVILLILTYLGHLQYETCFKWCIGIFIVGWRGLNQKRNTSIICVVATTITPPARDILCCKGPATVLRLVWGVFSYNRMMVVESIGAEILSSPKMAAISGTFGGILRWARGTVQS